MLMSSVLAKILSQIQSPNSVVPVQILAQAKPKDPPTDALPKFAGVFSKLHRVGILSKEQVSGKLIDEWNKTVASAETKPDTVDVSPAISSLLAVKDEEELVSLLVHYSTPFLILTQPRNVPVRRRTLRRHC